MLGGSGLCLRKTSRNAGGSLGARSQISTRAIEKKPLTAARQIQPMPFRMLDLHDLRFVNGDLDNAKIHGGDFLGDKRQPRGGAGIAACKSGFARFSSPH